MVNSFLFEMKPLLEVKRAIVVFHYAEKIKSSLILTASLLEFLSGMKDEEIIGAERLLVAYLNALIKEVSIAANASGIIGFQDVNVKLEEAIEQTKKHNYADAERLVSEAITITTTNGSHAAQTLKDKGLI
jgi:hypothetical protein